MKQYYVYIMASKPNGVLYIGMTNDLVRRVFEHKNDLISGFTKRYHVKRLVYYELFSDVEFAIKREKQMKNWSRQWKINLISKDNPRLDDLYQSIV